MQALPSTNKKEEVEMKVYEMQQKYIPALNVGEYECISSYMSVPFINYSENFDMTDDELCEWMSADPPIKYILKVIPDKEV